MCNAQLDANGGLDAKQREVHDHTRLGQPSTDGWTSKADMPVGRIAAAGLVLDGKLYVAGGRGSGAPGLTQVYNPGNNSWSTKAEMLTPRFHAAAATVDGLLFVLGGTDDLDFVKTNEVYIP
jgi:N-acetylneuraminic acid mutarotase